MAATIGSVDRYHGFILVPPYVRVLRGALLLAAFIAITSAFLSAWAAAKPDLQGDAIQALKELYQTNQIASEMSQGALAILVFPKMAKESLEATQVSGDGIMMKQGAVVNRYKSVAMSMDAEAATSSYSYVVFLMSQEAVDHVSAKGRWQWGVGPKVVVVNQSTVKTLASSPLQHDAYAFVFSQHGLVEDAGLDGTLITKIN